MVLDVLEDRHVKIGGLQVCYWALGDTGTPVILLHGLGASADIWMYNLESLSQQHRVYALDLPGFGRSDIPGPSFSPLAYKEVLDGFIGALKIDRPHLVGQSLGGAIALHYTLEFGEKVRSLVLVDSAGLGPEVIWTLRLLSLPLLGELFSYPTRTGVEVFFRLAIQDRSLVTKAFVDRYYAFFSRPGAQRFLLQIVRQTVGMGGARPEMVEPVIGGLDRITQPVLLVWGEKDRVLPVEQARFAKERLAHATLEIMKGCGHLPFFERSHEFNRLVLDFLK